MESNNGSWRPWTGYIPTREEMQEQDGMSAETPRVHPNGWFMLEYPSGKVEVCHLQEIRILDHFRVETYAPGQEGPVYDHGFYLPRMRPISKEKAMAWYAKHKIEPPLIGEDSARSSATAVPEETPTSATDTVPPRSFAGPEPGEDEAGTVG